MSNVGILFSCTSFLQPIQVSILGEVHSNEKNPTEVDAICVIAPSSCLDGGGAIQRGQDIWLKQLGEEDGDIGGKATVMGTTLSYGPGGSR